MAAAADPLRFGTVFLDRDGTLNVKAPEGDYITRPGELRLLPGVARAVRRLNEHRLRVIVVTNQRGVALGRMSRPDLRAVHDRLGHLLALEGGRLDALYACVHDLGSCPCRKPLPGLLLRAARLDPGVRPAASVMIGDSASDVEAGHRAGAATVRLGGPGHGDGGHQADAELPDLPAAVDWVLASNSQSRRPSG